MAETSSSIFAANSADAAAQLEKRIMELLRENEEGLGNDQLFKATELFDLRLRGEVVNKLLAGNSVEMLKLPGGAPGAFVLRLRRGSQLVNATPEEQLVFSLIEEADKMGVWIRDIRERSGLNEVQLRRILKSLEQRKLVKSVKAVGTTKKSYILYGIEADDSLTGGTFYSDQQLDSEFVQTLANVCVNLLQSRRRQAEEQHKTDVLVQRNAMYVESDEVARYIHEKGICRVQLGVADIEAILDIAVLDGRVEKRLNHTYRAVRLHRKPTALASVPCLQCPVQKECQPGYLISPENCEYFTKYFDL